MFNVLWCYASFTNCMYMFACVCVHTSHIDVHNTYNCSHVLYSIVSLLIVTPDHIHRYLTLTNENGYLKFNGFEIFR